MKDKNAMLRWLSPAEGGREAPPFGPSYSTVARFERLRDKWPEEAWSVVLEITSPADAGGVMLAGVRLLAPEAAPIDLLETGSRFELFEGLRCVAMGEVL